MFLEIRELLLAIFRNQRSAIDHFSDLNEEVLAELKATNNYFYSIDYMKQVISCTKIFLLNKCIAQIRDLFNPKCVIQLQKLVKFHTLFNYRKERKNKRKTG